MAKLTRAAYKAARDLRITSNANNEITGSIDRDDRGDLIDSAVLEEDGTEGLFDMPTKAGNALRLLRLNAGETDYEFVTISTTPVVVSQSVTGATSLDLATGDVFLLTVTGNVTGFTFTNEVVGKEYTFVFIKGAANNFTLSFAAAKWESIDGQLPELTDTVLTADTSVKDVLSSQCYEAGRLFVLEANRVLPN